jgi:hypothetical protein
MVIFASDGSLAEEERFRRVEQPKLDAKRLASVIAAAAKGQKLSAAEV